MLLKNNSKEMKTFVETFIVEETAELIYDNEKLEKWNELVTRLELKGQTKIVSEDKSPIPFMPLNTSLINVLKCLCPRAVDVDEYDVSAIPVEILDLIALSKNENYFNKIEIWYDDKTADPCCIGTLGYYYESTWSSDRNRSLEGKQFKTKAQWKEAGGISCNFSEDKKYILGKWADVKHSFEDLKKMATKRFISETSNELKARIKDAQRDLDDVESKAFSKFN